MTAALATLNQAALVTLADCEQRIERGLKSFIDVGEALATIRDSRLYRRTHATFEDYCSERWNLKRQRAYELMNAAAVVSEFSDTELPAPAKESHAAALAAVPEPERAEVWRDVVESGDKPTAAAIRRAAEARTAPPAEPERKPLGTTETPGPADAETPAPSAGPGSTSPEPERRSRPAAQPKPEIPAADLAEFPELEYYADRPAKAAALATQLRSFEPAEQRTRRETLAKVIQAERDGRLTQQPDPAAEAIDKADRLFLAMNEAAQTADKLGGIEAIEAAVAVADTRQIELWREQFSDLAATLVRLAGACRPQLRRVQ